jgi:hypothetical protein
MVGKIYLPSMHANMCIAFEKTSLNKYVQTFKNHSLKTQHLMEKILMNTFNERFKAHVFSSH